MMMFGHGGGWTAWDVVLMWLGIVAVAGLFVWAAYAVTGSASRRRASGPGEPAAGGDASGSTQRRGPFVRNLDGRSVLCGRKVVGFDSFSSAKHGSSV
jgi:hypothetical protein